MEKIIIDYSSITERRTSEMAQYFASRSSELINLCNELGIKATESVICKYSGHGGISAMKNDYIANELAKANNPTGRIADYVRSEASADFDTALQIHGFTGQTAIFRDLPQSQANEFVKFVKGSFVVDSDKIKENATTYLQETDRPIYDTHLQLCDLLTKFMGGTIEDLRQLDDYFKVEGGIIKPAFYGEYPPRAKK